MSTPHTQAGFSRHGAVDLSSLRTAKPAAGGGSYVLEVTEQTFDAEVVRRSLNYPIVVEFYSPRVSTGAQLSDALAAAASEAAGKYVVARVNVDTAPGLVGQLRLQAVPTVVGVVGGQLVPLFQGVLAADQVKLALDQLVKAAVANGVVGRAEPVGGAPAADDDGEAVADPRFAAADDALERGDFAAAVVEFDRLLAANPADAEAKAGRAQAALLARAMLLDGPAVLQRAASDPSVEAQLEAGDVEMVSGQAEAAFTRLLGVVRTRPADREAARLRLLDYFETLGNDDPRVPKARRDLMAALF